jgi:rSAM/selenodomain-associated transferase 2/rSAM/selenodomain-associated transferase 1
MSSDCSTLGIVIPALNEEETLPRLIGDLSRISIPHEVVVSDGGSCDGTRALAQEAGVHLVDAQRGRARQMNAGAKILETPWILFLHADSRLPETSIQALERWIRDADPQDFGAFAFALDGESPVWRVIEAGQRVRENLLGLAYGDQGLLVHRNLFHDAGGFPELPLFEDVEMLRRLRTRGRWKKIEAPLLTDPRRFQGEGAFKGWLRNVFLITLFHAGVSPERLSGFYPAREATPLPTLFIFAKAPTPGRVKTRLAKEVGDEEAARVYSLLARYVVNRLRSGPYRTVICFDPPGKREAVVGWLGDEQLSFIPQKEGDLGVRMETAIREGLRNSPAVVVVGTDTPGVDGEVVARALESLKGGDLVVGPATDGGYYLIGMKEPHSQLFRDIPWSTHRVLESTLERAEELGLRASLLPPLQDVDTLEDWESVRPSLGD